MKAPLPFDRIRAHAHKLVQRLRWDLYLREWSIEFNWESLPPSIAARVDLDSIEYLKATITIDHGKVTSLKELTRTLRHEMLHLLAAPFAEYRNVAAELCDSNNEKAMLGEALRLADEKFVARMERMLDLGAPAKWRL